MIKIIFWIIFLYLVYLCIIKILAMMLLYDHISTKQELILWLLSWVPVVEFIVLLVLLLVYTKNKIICACDRIDEKWKELD